MKASTTVFSAAASLAASVMLVRTISNDLVPRRVQDYIFSSITNLLTRCSTQIIMIIEELEGLSANHMYKAADSYLGTKVSPSTRRLKVSTQGKEHNITVTIARGEELVDVFQGVQFKWRLLCRQSPRPSPMLHRRHHQLPMETGMTFESKSYRLTFHKKHKAMALSSYLPHILHQAKMIRNETRTRRLYTNDNGGWTSVNLHHPATFETLAMDPELKRALMEDLTRFVGRKEYYKRIGKAWKRGYLLYGPPGTGKSTMVAAMANFLKFDVYDLELTEVRSNSNLRKLLVGTANRSILVVEDIDCTVKLQGREPEKGSKNKQSVEGEDKVTLSGLLNFVDGLWSGCGDERIIVFTTNFKDRIEPALLRPGRMDMHIHMSYLCPSGFRVLASNYHGIDHHPLFGKIDGLLSEVEATPAEVAEELLRSDDAAIALQGLIEFLETKSKGTNEAEAREECEGEIRKHEDLAEGEQISKEDDD